MAKIKINIRYLKACGVIMAKDDIRYYLNGVLIEVRERDVLMIATNGHAFLMMRDGSDAAIHEPARFIIPGDVVNAAALTGFGWLEYDPANACAECALRGLASPSMVFTPIEGKYPDWTRLMPKSAPSGVHGDFQGCYWSAFQEAANIAFGRHNLNAQIWPNGNDAAPVLCDMDDFFGIIMPFKGTDVYKQPAWLPNA